MPYFLRKMSWGSLRQGLDYCVIAAEGTSKNTGGGQRDELDSGDGHGEADQRLGATLDLVLDGLPARGGVGRSAVLGSGGGVRAARRRVGVGLVERRDLVPVGHVLGAAALQRVLHVVDREVLRATSTNC